MTSKLDFETYWKLVFGAHDAAYLCRTFDLVDDKASLSTWIGKSESDAASARYSINSEEYDSFLSACAEHHEAALAELLDCIE